jgi:hypothetical protein
MVDKELATQFHGRGRHELFLEKLGERAAVVDTVYDLGQYDLPRETVRKPQVAAERIVRVHAQTK